jgi:hypothetical protein
VGTAILGQKEGYVVFLVSGQRKKSKEKYKNRSSQYGTDWEEENRGLRTLRQPLTVPFLIPICCTLPFLKLSLHVSYTGCQKSLAQYRCNGTITDALTNQSSDGGHIGVAVKTQSALAT